MSENMKLFCVEKKSYYICKRKERDSSHNNFSLECE